MIKFLSALILLLVTTAAQAERIRDLTSVQGAVSYTHLFTAIADRVIHVREGSVAAVELNEAPLSADVLEW